jgi:SAM-dependent methyltransferase
VTRTEEPMPPSSLDELIAQLPERYQPIYGYVDDTTSRAADSPRTEAIVTIADGLARALERPLRVLDLGSAQGYYAFLLADRGHFVLGVDYLPINVAVSRAIHHTHPHLTVEFVEADLSTLSNLVVEGDFDLVLGLSVLHHIAFRDGHDQAIAMVQLLREHVPHGVFEMALRDEPVYWADRLPADPRVTLAPYEFIRELARSRTHLSDIERPLFFCSRTHALMRGELHRIDRFAETSHPAASDVLRGKRRYYDIEGGIIKIAAHFGACVDVAQLDAIRSEMRHESTVIDQLAGVLTDLPTVFEFAESSHEILIGKSAFPGQLVSELAEDLSADERATIFDQVLDQLVQLEAHGWYHTDLRTWNVVWNAELQRAWLIDHGAIRREPTDAVWPNDACYSLLAFTIALWTGVVEQTGIDAPRGLLLEIDELPEHIGHSIVSTLLAPRHEKFVDAFAHVVRSATTSPTDSTTLPLAVDWLSRLSTAADGSYADLRGELRSLNAAYERLQAGHTELLDGLAHISEQYESTLTSRSALEDEYHRTLAAYHGLDEQYQSVLQKYERVSAVYEAARVSLEASTNDVVALRDVARRAVADRDALAHEAEVARYRLAELDQLVTAMSRTVSWRLTRPLRGIRRLLR